MIRKNFSYLALLATQNSCNALQNTLLKAGAKTHELRNEVLSDPMPLFWSIFLKEVEMIYFQKERVTIKQGKSYDTSFLQ